METIDRSGAEIAFVIDDTERLIGTVSDGDLRRALLDGAGLGDAVLPFTNRRHRTVTPQAGRAEVLDMMQAFTIAQIPVIGDDGRLVGAHLLKDVLGGERHDVVAVVMAGGEGLRLRPLTEQLPKPMLLVAGRPILERIVMHLIGRGVRTIYLAVNYMSDVIEAHFGSGQRFGCDIHYLKEAADLPLGTAGALGLLPASVLGSGLPILVVNGDLITQFDLGALLRQHESETAALTIGVRPYTHQIPFGVVHVAETSVQRIDEKPAPTWTVSAGVYVLGPAVTDGVDGTRRVDVTDLIERALDRGHRVTAFAIDGEWADIGRSDELSRARGHLP